MNYTASPLIKNKSLLGEGVIWDYAHLLLYYIDILGQKVFQYDPSTGIRKEFFIGHDVGSVVISEKNTLILAVKEGFLEFDPITLQSNFLHKIAMKNNMRFNDGKCDPAGRFWAGTMDYDGKKNEGSLYCLNTDLTVKKVIDQVSISNGIVWTTDQKTMYYIDSPTYQVVAFDYDIESGNISNKRIVINIDRKIGIPDGMAIDEQGNLWIALYGGGGVGCWNPYTGKQLSFITVPGAQLVTSCTFGGEDLQDLYITTASVGLDKGALDQQPHAGYLFHVKLPVKGTICTKFKG